MHRKKMSQAVSHDKCLFRVLLFPTNYGAGGRSGINPPGCLPSYAPFAILDHLNILTMDVYIRVFTLRVYLSGILTHLLNI